MKNKSYAFIVIICIFIISFVIYQLNTKENFTTKEVLNAQDFYSVNVEPIFNAKCIACHSCYNSPCQLNLTSYYSTIRGANQTSIYDFPKLESREPTRMFIDSNSIEGWRKKDFYPVVGNNKISILNYMITNPHGIESGKQEKYLAEESRVCMKSLDDKDAYEKENPAGRMPYGFPGLAADEIKILKTWQDIGSPGPELTTQEHKIITYDQVSIKVKEWEDFFNRSSLKEKLASRYIYEHLFLAHIYFSNYPNINFRLVRSKTVTGPINEIGTLYPFDDPKTEFSYRLRPVLDTIVHKSHIPFEFNDTKKDKWNTDFYNSKWDYIPKEMPSYGREGSNPYKTFAAIPAKSRYQFFLDESSYHIMTFIKGPVCRGQTALNVINDHFWVFFLDPDHDPLVNSKNLYESITKKMILPAELRDDFKPLVNLRKNYWATIEEKYKYLNTKTLSTAWLWNGKKEDNDASITVSRHFDSAHVMKGLQGEIPKTVWVLDYHVFESIYYNLTAGYNVFGPLLHQINSRLFMEISRISSEDLFLSFLKPDLRIKTREQWNTPVPRKDESFFKKVVDTFSNDAKEEMDYNYIYHGNTLKVAKDYNKESLINEIKSDRLTKEQIQSGKIELTSSLEKLKNLKSPVLRYLPDTIIFSVEEVVYTLVHNKAHYNVSMLFFEHDRRNYEKDTIDIIPGIVTSYANAFMRLENKSLDKFITEVENSKTQNELWLVLKKYIISRGDKNFWEHYQYFSDHTYEKSTNEYGYLDLNRYMNI